MEKHVSFIYRGQDQVDISASKWFVENQQPKAIIQISHGMAEHIKRYDSFAKYLVSHQIFVYGNDHRGHGKTGELNLSYGYFADTNGFEKVVHDMYSLTKIIKKDYQDVPVFLFGHSMGSFLTIRYMQIFGKEIAGGILSGTGGNPGFIGKIGKMIASLEISIKGRKQPSAILHRLTFGSYNNAFKPNRTEFDWLSRNEQEVDKYIADPLCGAMFTSGFFFDLLEGMDILYKQENIRAIETNLPILFISGSQDPVGKQTKDVLKTYQAFKKSGLKDVTYKFFQDARHELLNEINREEVLEYLITWIKMRLNRSE